MIIAYNINAWNMNIKKLIESLIELTLIVMVVLGTVFSVTGSKFMAGPTAFLFFTIQSNLTIAGISLVFLISNVLELCGKKGFINNTLLLIKYTFTVAITITFLVFFIALAPLVGKDYLFSFNNMSVHLIVPLLALTDFFVFDSKIRLTKVTCLLGCAMPLYYLIFFLIGIPLGFRYVNNDVAPYFFLNFKTYGWFTITSKGPGVFYWILIMLVAISALCYLFLLLVTLRKKLDKKND